MDNRTVKISVIVLTYNHEKYIRQALDSILMQDTAFRYEILIGDDASTDHTVKIIIEYASKYPDIIVPFLRKKNIGATKNLYDLLTRAKGDYIANLEGDDFWTDDQKLQLQTEWLEEHPEYMGCYHLCKTIDENGYEVRTPKWVREKDFFSLKDFGGVFLPGHPSTWIYRNIYREPRYDYTVIYKAHTLIADRTIATILLSQGNFGFISRTMSCYRSIIKKNGQNVTSKLFVENDDSKLIEYQLTLKLEAYAQNELKVHVDFSRFRRLLFIKSIIKLLIKPSHKRWLCAKGIISLRLRAFMSVKGDY
ncbi:glycosyltransferase family 2 protein [Flavonifractor sp. An306]|uniref:glycosyltransferase family 2 protein n=1 Tax=Flavonifractor sp. An306 TaxID=1965629 RepID=UPI000B3AAE1B|nr:glycosyltransferase family 2 protein [Flavonifractor sp. An306]